MKSSRPRQLLTTVQLSLRSSSQPLLHRTVPSRLFSISTPHSSQIGKAPISIPPEVTFTVLPPVTPKYRTRTPPNPSVAIKGPLGELSLEIPNFLKVEHDEASKKVLVSVEDREVRRQREMWGTTRACLQNHVLGVSEGHTCILRLVGVGYRATVESKAVTKSAEYPGQQFVSLKVGYSHPIELGVPPGVKVSTPQPTRILIEGCDKATIKQFAAKIRKWRVPEPYKGKGIFVDDETIKLKAKKIK